MAFQTRTVCVIEVEIFHSRFPSIFDALHMRAMNIWMKVFFVYVDGCIGGGVYSPIG